MNEFDKAKAIINEIISNIPKIDKDDPRRELKIFTYIYCRLGRLLEYDYFAADLMDVPKSGLNRERANEDIIEPACDIRGLARGKAICVGFSEILKATLEKINIKSNTVDGSKHKTLPSGHVWNQVCLDGIWYNCDLTCDRNSIKDGLKCQHFLKNDAEFINHKDYGVIKNKQEICTKSISDEEQERLINDAIKIINMQEQEQKQIEVHKEVENHSFIIKLKKFIEEKLYQEKRSR